MNEEQMKDDEGPWQVDVWHSCGKVVLQSHDGTHDVALAISGDFLDINQEIEYANMLCSRLNAMPGTRPLNWRTKEHDEKSG